MAICPSRSKTLALIRIRAIRATTTTITTLVAARLVALALQMVHLVALAVQAVPEALVVLLIKAHQAALEAVHRHRFLAQAEEVYVVLLL